MTYNKAQETWGLYLAAMQGKFDLTPRRRELDASPYVSQALNRLYDEITSGCLDKEEGFHPSIAEGMRANRVIAIDSEVGQIVLSRLNEAKSESFWARFSRSEREQYLIGLAAPFQLSETDRNHLLDA